MGDRLLQVLASYEPTDADQEEMRRAYCAGMPTRTEREQMASRFGSPPTFEDMQEMHDSIFPLRIR